MKTINLKIPKTSSKSFKNHQGGTLRVVLRTSKRWTQLINGANYMKFIRIRIVLVVNKRNLPFRLIKDYRNKDLFLSLKSRIQME